jgi:hypothetical protein
VKHLSTIAGIGSFTASVFQSRPTSAATTNAAAADDTSNSVASSTPSNVASGPTSAASSPLAPNVLSQLLNAQADASSPGGAGADAISKLTIVNNADLPHINLLTNLTANDRQFITAATGSVISDDGTVTNPTTGGSAANPTDTSVNPFILQIASARLNGTLTGDITPTYFQHLASQDSELGQPIDPNVLSAGLQYLENQNTAKSQTPGSTAAA